MLTYNRYSGQIAISFTRSYIIGIGILLTVRTGERGLVSSLDVCDTEKSLIITSFGHTAVLNHF